MICNDERNRLLIVVQMNLWQNAENRKYYVESVLLFSDVLLLKRLFYFTCDITSDVSICSELEFGALRPLSEQSSSSNADVGWVFV